MFIVALIAREHGGEDHLFLISLTFPCRVLLDLRWRHVEECGRMSEDGLNDTRSTPETARGVPSSGERALIYYDVRKVSSKL